MATLEPRDRGGRLEHQGSLGNGGYGLLQAEGGTRVTLVNRVHVASVGSPVLASKVILGSLDQKENLGSVGSPVPVGSAVKLGLVSKAILGSPVRRVIQVYLGS